MAHCNNCDRDISTVDDVRQCSTCQANGTAGRVHCRHVGSDPIANAMQDGGGLPFTVAPAAEAQPKDTDAVTADASAETSAEGDSQERRTLPPQGAVHRADQSDDSPLVRLDDVVRDTSQTPGQE